MNEKSMILTIVGSGSTYLPDLGEILMERRETLNVAEMRLMDIDEYRLKATGNFLRKMYEDAGMPTQITMTTNLEEAVQGANFVITTIRPGLSEARILDETIPFKHGLIGQETTAPGGMIMGFKTIPAMLKIANTIEKYAEKGCYLINLANPSGMIAEALERHSKIKYACLCNGPTVIRKAMNTIYKPDEPNDLFVEVIGLNHLIWCKVFYKGEDVTNEAFTKLLDWFEVNVPRLRTEFVEEEIQKFIGWIPMGPYLRFYYNYPGSFDDLGHADVHWSAMFANIKDKIGNIMGDVKFEDYPTRAQMVQYVESVTLKLYKKLDMDGYKLATMTRGGKDYGFAGISLMDAIWNNKNEIHSPDVKSMGTIEGLNSDSVCTTTALVNGFGIHPIAFPKLPGHMMSKILAAKEYEKLAVKAAVTGSYNMALEALLANPLVNSYYNAKGALDELLITEKKWLPNFAEAISALENGEELKF